MTQPVMVIVLCPCCASAIDAEANAEQDQQFICIACGQMWVMTVDADRHEAHSLH